MQRFLPLIPTALLLLTTPILFVLSGWQWRPDAITTSTWLATLYGITLTGSFPSGIFTATILTIWLASDIHQTKRWYFVLMVLLIMGFTQASKSVLKHAFALPRPYISTAMQHNQERITQFYASTKSTQKSMIAAAYTNTPQYIVKDREKEIAYRFPSGHTIFAASWALLFAAFAHTRRKVVIVTIWASAVMASRVWLGMHTPSDLAASVILALLTVCSFIYGWQYFVIHKPLQPPITDTQSL